MTLFIDIGNSRIKWQQSDQFAALPNVFTYQKTALSEQLNNNLKACPIPDDEVVIVSVAGDKVNSEIESWIKATWGVGVRFLHTQRQWKTLQSGYLETEALGADRWYALIGAASRYSFPLITVDIGSAITIDIVNSTGLHLGGYITPGIDMMKRSLDAGTNINFNYSQPLTKNATVPTDTMSAINSGILLSIAAFIDSVCVSVENDSICILTGGGASQIAPLVNSSVIVDRNLIFFGMQKHD